MKKEELRKDPIIELIIRFVGHLKNKKNLVFQSIVALIIIIGGIGYTNHMRNLTISNAKNLSGLAQNNYVNGQSEMALSQFNTILSEYPNTKASIHSMIYILKNAIESNKMDTLSELINNNAIINNASISPFILHMEADAKMQANNFSEAIVLYNEAISKTDNIDYKDRFRISLSYALISNNMISQAKKIIDKILNNESAKYKNKNMAEEISSYLKFIDGI